MLDDLVREHLAARAADLGWTAYVLALWEHHLAVGFANGHFVRELTKGVDGPFLQRVWEMMVGRHLVACGYDVSSPTSTGMPDFRCSKGGTVTWVEATCATAGQDASLAPDAEWLLSGGYVPHDKILLRWTNALDQKIKQCAARRRSGSVAAGEGYLIAINGGAVGTANYGFGVSRLPYVVEASLAVGPLQFSYGREALAFRGAAHQARVHATKGGSATVSTAAFYDRSNSGIAALLGIGSMRVEMAVLPLLVAHNPFRELDNVRDPAPLAGLKFGALDREAEAARTHPVLKVQREQHAVRARYDPEGQTVLRRLRSHRISLLALVAVRKTSQRAGPDAPAPSGPPPPGSPRPECNVRRRVAFRPRRSSRGPTSRGPRTP